MGCAACGLGPWWDAVQGRDAARDARAGGGGVRRDRACPCHMDARVVWAPGPASTGAASSVETQESVIRTSVLAALAELHQIRRGAAPMADRLEGLADGV